MQMPSGLPARVVVLCTLMCGVSIARAERRPVAVIDLSGDPASARLAAELNPVLLGHPELQPIDDASIPPELYGPFRDDDQDHVAAATSSQRTAEGELARFSFEVAHRSATNGEEQLQQVLPTPPVLALYAQLAFLRGQALLGIPRRAAEAPAAFALAHRLDPTFVPDPARYLPDVVQAFDAAQQRWTGQGTLAVAGTGRLWIDGKDRGTAPAEVEVAAGPHVVWLTGPDRETTARAAPAVEAGRAAKVEIPDAPASHALKVRRARAALRYAPDPAARAAAMRTLAELVGVRDAVLLTSANGKVIVQTWNASTRDQAPGFSALRELEGERPLDLLAPLAPPKPKVDDPGTQPPVQPPVVDTRRWYERRTVQASIAIGVVAAIIGGYYVYKAMTDDTVGLDPNISQAVLRW